MIFGWFFFLKKKKTGGKKQDIRSKISCFFDFREKKQDIWIKKKIQKKEQGGKNRIFGAADEFFLKKQVGKNRKFGRFFFFQKKNREVKTWYLANFFSKKTLEEKNRQNILKTSEKAWDIVLLRLQLKETQNMNRKKEMVLRNERKLIKIGNMILIPCKHFYKSSMSSSFDSSTMGMNEFLFLFPYP